MIKEKVFSVQCEADLNQTRKRDQPNMMSMASKGGDALQAMLAAGQSINVVNIGEGFDMRNDIDMAAAQETFDKNKDIVLKKGQHKDWQERELALNAMHECFEVAPQKIIRDQREFLATCCQILKKCLEENNI